MPEGQALIACGAFVTMRMGKWLFCDLNLHGRKVIILWSNTAVHG